MTCPLRAERDRLERRLEEIHFEHARRVKQFRAVQGTPNEHSAILKLQAIKRVRRGIGRRLFEINSRICEENGGPVQVSDHALMRWLERKHGVSREDLEGEMLDFFGVPIGANTAIVERDGWKAVIKGRTIVTVKSPDMVDAPSYFRERGSRASSDEGIFDAAD